MATKTRVTQARVVIARTGRRVMKLKLVLETMLLIKKWQLIVACLDIGHPMHETVEHGYAPCPHDHYLQSLLCWIVLTMSRCRDC